MGKRTALRNLKRRRRDEVTKVTEALLPPDSIRRHIKRVKMLARP